MFVALKPLAERKVSADQVIARLRPQAGHRARREPVPAGGPGRARRRAARATRAYQYTLQGDDLEELNQWAPRMLRKLRTLPELADVNSDQQNRGLRGRRW